MKVAVRKANAEDAATVWKIRNAAILNGCKSHYPVELLKVWTEGEITEQFVRNVVEQFYVAVVGGEVVGTGAIDLNKGQLDAVFVRPDMMGRGIGRQIAAHLELIAYESGLAQLTLDSTLNAAGFYRRYGFVGEDVSTYQSPRGINLECVPMAKRLVPRPSDD